MNILSKIFNGKAAFQSVDLSDIYIPLSDEQRFELQRILLEMYHDILVVSEENAFTPFLVGGSALGAVRHGGFIPWDDDLDVAFLRDEYEKFLVKYKEKFPDKYLVNAPGKQDRTRARFTKILKKGTILRDMISLPDDELNGIYVDIFPIDNVPNNMFLRGIKGLVSDLLAYISSQVFNKDNRTNDSVIAFKRSGKINYAVRMAIGFIFSFRSASWWFNLYDRCIQWGDKKSTYCTIASGRKHYFGEIIKRCAVLPPRFVQFDKFSAPVFSNVEEYLSQMYGNYLEIPSEEKRERHFVKDIKF